MRQLDQCSGKWAGQWIQESVRGTMRLTLQFVEGSVFGEGKDSSGSFEMVGSFSPNGEVRLQKTYRFEDVLFRNAAPELLYAGLWDGSLIAGTWVQAGYGFNRGDFELWPESEEEALSDSHELELSHPGGIT